MNTKSIAKSLKRITREINKIQTALNIENQANIQHHTHIREQRRNMSFQDQGPHNMEQPRKRYNKYVKPEAILCDNDLILKIIKQGGL